MSDFYSQDTPSESNHPSVSRLLRPETPVSWISEGALEITLCSLLIYSQKLRAREKKLLTKASDLK